MTSDVPLAAVATSPPLSSKPGVGEHLSVGADHVAVRVLTEDPGVASVGRDPARVNGRTPEPRHLWSADKYFSSED